MVRALVCLNSSDFGIANSGMAWLQGQEIEPDDRERLGFGIGTKTPRSIVESLSWLMSLSGPTVVAFDQLDPIVHQLGHDGIGNGSTEEQAHARSIIEEIGGGLADMVRTMKRTLTVVSCVETTWSIMEQLVLRTYLDSFDKPIRLQRPRQQTVFEALIQSRLAPVYAKYHFVPPYPTWPFRPEAIAQLTSDTPREVLKLCEQFRQSCKDGGNVTELEDFTKLGTEPRQLDVEPGFTRLDEMYAEYQRRARPRELLDELQEDDSLAPLYETALQCLVYETEDRLPEGVDALVEKDFSGGKGTKPLHARLRIIFHNENSREEHYCVRSLQKKHHAAYQSRLKAAMTQSGIDKALKFRHLTIIRSESFPGGPKTQELTNRFRNAGGKFHEPSEGELRRLFALYKLVDKNDPNFPSWLRSRQPLMNVGLADVLVPSPILHAGKKEFSKVSEQDSRSHEDAATASAMPGMTSPLHELESSQTPEERRNQNTTATAFVTAPDGTVCEDVPPPKTESNAMEDIPFPLGDRIIGIDRPGECFKIPVQLLAKHAIILGGSGSGKTVTVRRFVEEAALLGVPSIVIDCARDMAYFDERWQKSPASSRAGDEELARRFHEKAEQIVWTPGRDSGNPLALEPLPNFSSLSDDDELEAAVQMACDALKQIVAPGFSLKARNKEGLLTNSLRYFARHFADGGLREYVALLDELTSEAGLGIKNEDGLAREMADSLKVEMVKNPLLRSSGNPLDPAILLGDDQPGHRKVRISVVSLAGLHGDRAQFYFLNQMAMLLFSWIKKNPTPPENRPLRGLLVIDEAKDFVPALKKTACKDSIMRLAAQARKYRLGLIFATQHPKDIDTKIVGNCATHLYGLNNSPASLDTLHELMRQKGGSGTDIPKLKAGQFYVHNADSGHKQPIKIKIPMSLSRLPNSPLEETEIRKKRANPGGYWRRSNRNQRFTYANSVCSYGNIAMSQTDTARTAPTRSRH